MGVDGLQTNDSQSVVKIYFKPTSSNNLLLVTAVIFKKPTKYLAEKFNLNCDSNNFNSADKRCSPLQELDIIFSCDILGKKLNGDKINLGILGPYALGTYYF